MPTPPRRAWLRSFWLVLWLGVGLLVASVVALVASPARSVWALIAIPVLVVPGLVRPELAAAPYSAWNAAARLFCRGASVLVRGICFYLVITAVGRTGSALALGRPGSADSLWVSRRTPKTLRYLLQYEAGTARPPRGGWIRAYLGWALDSGNGWAVCLLPFFALLSVFESGRPDSATPAQNYTLY
ncbi:MAG: hypothetical protein ACREMB_04080 [Candidatus Rokuibacteriota bacterium]